MEIFLKAPRLCTLIVIQYHSHCKCIVLHLNCVFWAAFNNCRFVQFAVIADVETGVFLTLAPPISPDRAAAREHAAFDMEELNHIFFFFLFPRCTELNLIRCYITSARCCMANLIKKNQYASPTLADSFTSWRLWEKTALRRILQPL